MTRALTGSQLKKLGERIAKASAPNADDLELLRLYREAHIDMLATAFATVRQATTTTDATRSARIKNAATIVHKLRFQRTALAKMRDIAGIRVVLAHGDRAEQDRVASELLRLLNGAKKVDRRVEPKSGYRAVHVVGTLDAKSLEIQVRTALQHDWAQMFERLADLFGRQIRYGDAPDDGDDLTIDGASVDRQDVITQAQQLATRIDEFERQPGGGQSLDDIRGELDAFAQAIVSAASGTQDSGTDTPASSPTMESGWNLVVYDRAQGRTTQAVHDERMNLIGRWRELEAQRRDDPNIEIVLLDIESEAAARTTHERYFSPTPGLRKPNS